MGAETFKEVLRSTALDCVTDVDPQIQIKEGADNIPSLLLATLTTGAIAEGRTSPSCSNVVTSGSLALPALVDLAIASATTLCGSE